MSKKPRKDWIKYRREWIDPNYKNGKVWKCPGCGKTLDIYPCVSCRIGSYIEFQTINREGKNVRVHRNNA